MKPFSEWSELHKRLASSLVLIPIAIFCLWYGGWFYNGLILLVMVGLVWEGETLLQQPLKSWRGALFLLWPLAAGLIAIKGDFLELLYFSMSASLFGFRPWGPIIISIIGGSSLLFLRTRAEGLMEVFLVLGAVIASDSGAYIVGRLVGGPKLAPYISPGKTISGSIGGIVTAFLFSGLLIGWGTGEWSVQAFFWGGVLSLATQTGDLMESAFKRRIGVKDSGTLIPGHGGLLDRFDGLLVAAPLAACLALLSGEHPFWQLGLHFGQ
ncbi:phosphatidate cytidylyltransferase [Acetobacteraceae bacterium ESL0709]|nr:phosphatidate cytidylyltransferase [Acetobacteraceae bacterium ESL0697]MDF7677729.1 phosphatidate cytidylyltransferase [Acetobacteraceae bacterium ESL0709]